MRTITAEDRQTLYDLALLALGRAEAAYDLAEANGLALDAVPGAGAVLRVPEAEGGADEAVTAAYALQGVRPATAPTAEELAELRPEGIGHWWVAAPSPFFVVSPGGG